MKTKSARICHHPRPSSTSHSSNIIHTYHATTAQTNACEVGLASLKIRLVKHKINKAKTPQRCVNHPAGALALLLRCTRRVCPLPLSGRRALLTLTLTRSKGILLVVVAAQRRVKLDATQFVLLDELVLHVEPHEPSAQDARGHQDSEPCGRHTRSTSACCWFCSELLMKKRGNVNAISTTAQVGQAVETAGRNTHTHAHTGGEGREKTHTHTHAHTSQVARQLQNVAPSAIISARVCVLVPFDAPS